MSAPHEHPMPGQVLGHIEKFDSYTEFGADVTVVNDLDEANVITSRIAWSVESGVPMHKILLDIDLPMKVVPSSTEGHGHLYIDYGVTWEQYQQLLTVMAEIGLIQQGYAAASIKREHTTLRLPWVRKEPTAPATGEVEPF